MEYEIPRLHFYYIRTILAWLLYTFNTIFLIAYEKYVYVPLYVPVIFLILLKFALDRDDKTKYKQSTKPSTNIQQNQVQTVNKRL